MHSFARLKQIINKPFFEKDHKIIPKLKKHIINGEAHAFNEAITKAIENPHFDINEQDDKGVTLLGNCIEYSNFECFKKLIDLGCDVNKGSKYSGLITIKERRFFGEEDPLLPPLLHLYIYIVKHYNELASFKMSQPKILKMVVTLMNHPSSQLASLGINKEHSILAHYAKTIRLEDLENAELKLNENVARQLDVLKQIVIAGHRFSLSGVLEIEKHRINLEGFHLGIAAQEFVNTYSNFIKNKDIQRELNELYNQTYETKNVDYFRSERTTKELELEIATSIRTELKCIAHPIAKDDFIKKYAAKDFIPVYISEPGHAITYLFYDEYCLRINCGESSDIYEEPGIKIYQVYDKQAMLDEIPNLLDSSKRNISDSYLKGEFERISKLKLIHTIKRPSQTTGNCTFRSLEELLHALFIMHMFKYFSSLKHENISKIFDVRKFLFKEAFKRAEEAGDIAFNIFMHYEKDLGALHVKALDKYLTDEIKKNIRKEQMKKTSLDHLQKKWKPIYNGIKDPSEIKKDILQQELILTKEEVQHIALKHALLNEKSDLPGFFDYIENSRQLKTNLDADDLSGLDNLTASLSYEMFMASLKGHGVKTIHFDQKNHHFQLGLNEEVTANEFRSFMSSLYNTRSKMRSI